MAIHRRGILQLDLLENYTAITLSLQLSFYLKLFPSPIIFTALKQKGIDVVIELKRQSVPVTINNTKAY